MAKQQYAQQLDEVRSLIRKTAAAIPAHRTAFKAGYTFSKDAFEAQLPVWNYVWKHAAAFREQLHAYFFLEKYVDKKELHKQLWETSVAWQDDINDWPLCDSLSKINSKVLVSYPAEVYARLQAWNKDSNLWKRRQSVVSLLYYSRTKKDYLPFTKIIALITPLLTDKEYYVQKGVGWALREVYNVYPTETMSFFKKHIKDISAIAFTAAVEKLGVAEKDELKGMRKSG